MIREGMEGMEVDEKSGSAGLHGTLVGVDTVSLALYLIGCIFMDLGSMDKKSYFLLHRRDDLFC